MPDRAPLNWAAIRSLNGRQDQGFEELCAQLAAEEVPKDATFVRKGTPDGGVECYAALSDGSEWGWQSKYFLSSPGISQWRQIEASVTSALEKHPTLVRYYICLPIDLPDGRVGRAKSARDRWDEYVRTWERRANRMGRRVAFIFWGSHELLSRLSKREHEGRLRFWFDASRFDGRWFRSRLEEALSAAGPRYTPELNVQLPIASDFEAFGRTETFFDELLRLRRHLRNEYETFRASGFSGRSRSTESGLSEVLSDVQDTLQEFEAMPCSAVAPLPLSQVVDRIHRLNHRVDRMVERLRREESRPASESFVAQPFLSREIRGRLLRLNVELRRIRGRLEQLNTLSCGRLLIVRGPAGAGKTHLLCDVARERIQRGHPTILLLGQRFVSRDDPWTQVLQQLDIGGDMSAERLVGALEATAQSAGVRLLFMIDAINEGTGRAIWPSHISSFLKRLDRSPWIAVVLSVRTAYEEQVLSEAVRDRAVLITHNGFEQHEYDAAKAFFTFYGLELPSTPLLSQEFRNPLFLKILCRGLSQREESWTHRGPDGISSIFTLYLESTERRLADDLDYHPATRLVRHALIDLAREQIALGKRWLSLERAQRVVNDYLPDRGYRRSLYHGLVSEGLLVEASWQDERGWSQEFVYFAYERLADYLMAQVLIDNHGDVERFSAWINTPSHRGREPGLLDHPGLLQMLSVQLPERLGIELLDLIAEDQQWEARKRAVVVPFIESLIWRASRAFSERTYQILVEQSQATSNLTPVLEAMLTVSTVAGHPLNAHLLSGWLLSCEMAERDAWWGIYLHSAWGRKGAVDRMVDWTASLSSETYLEDETVDLSGLTLAWMLTTSNRFLRDRATKALVRLYDGRPARLVRLLQEMASINDLYVAERLCAVAYGVVMRSDDVDAVAIIAHSVLDTIFRDAEPPSHILLRDYARGVVERALYLGYHTPVDPVVMRPPYPSEPPDLSNDDLGRFYALLDEGGSYLIEDPDWARRKIIRSVITGDFARYIVGTEYGAAGAQALQVFILDTIFSLGWTTERFADFDQHAVRQYGRAAAKAERMGKKYQWLAFHILAGLLTDHHPIVDVRRRESTSRSYEGPWQTPRLRDIDPSILLRSTHGRPMQAAGVRSWWVPDTYDQWSPLLSPEDWLKSKDGWPWVEQLLKPIRKGEERWINSYGKVGWCQAGPKRRSVYYWWSGYLVPQKVREEAVHFLWQRPELLKYAFNVRSLRDMFIGEYGWSPCARELEGRTNPSRLIVALDEASISARPMAMEYRWEWGAIDCSLDEDCRLYIPEFQIGRDLGLLWSGKVSQFCDAAGAQLALDPSTLEEGPPALMFKEARLSRYLAENELSLVWVVHCLKRVEHSAMDSASFIFEPTADLGDPESNISSRSTGLVWWSGKEMSGRWLQNE